MNDDDTSSRGRRAEKGQRRTFDRGRRLVDEVDGTVTTSSRNRQYVTTPDSIQSSISVTRLPFAQEDREHTTLGHPQISHPARHMVQQEAPQAGYRPQGQSKSLKSCIQLRQDCTPQRSQCLNFITDQEVSPAGATPREERGDIVTREDNRGLITDETDSRCRPFEQDSSPSEQAHPRGYSPRRQVQRFNMTEESIDQRPRLIERALQQSSGERYEIVTSASSLKERFYRYD